MFLPSLVDAVASVDSFTQAHSGTAVGDAWTTTSLGCDMGGGVVFVFKHPFSNLFESSALISWPCLGRKSRGVGK